MEITANLNPSSSFLDVESLSVITDLVEDTNKEPYYNVNATQLICKGG